VNVVKIVPYYVLYCIYAPLSVKALHVSNLHIHIYSSIKYQVVGSKMDYPILHDLFVPHNPTENASKEN
jgi:hypothetical protein